MGSNKGHRGATSKSPKAKQNMKREAEKNERKAPAFKTYSKMSDLMKGEKNG